MPQPTTPPALPAPPTGGTFTVPPVVERPLNPEEGERVFVKKFVLEGAVNRPKQGVVLDDIRSMLEKERSKLEGLDKVGTDGFTKDEREQIRSFMREVVDNKDLDMKFEDYQALVDKLRQERAKRMAGLTVGQLSEIAKAVTDYYRNAGFILAQAYVPAQEVSDGVVKIQVVEGKLGNVLAEGNKRYSEKLLASPFENLIDAPVTASSAESALLTVNDLPGMSAVGVFRPGKKVGSSELLLRVQKEKPFTATARIDNHGTRFTGERRGSAEITVNNPFGLGDRLDASVLQTWMPTNSIFYSANYDLPMFSPYVHFGGGYLKNNFDVGSTFQALGIAGETQSADAYLRATLLRSREKNLYATLRVTRKENQTLQNNQLLSRDNLSFVTAEMDFDNIETASKAINQASFSVTSGLGGLLGGMTQGDIVADTIKSSRQGASGTYADNRFTKLAASYSRLQKLNFENQSVLLRLEGQWSNSLLTSTEQYSIGGPNNLRAYPIAAFLADTALFGSVQWNINAPFFADKPAFRNLTWGQILRVSFFTDFATGHINDATTNQHPIGLLAGYGTGIQLNIPGEFSARFQAARRFPSSKPPPDAVDDTTHYWFDLSYTF